MGLVEKGKLVYIFPIRKTVVSQFGQVPFAAGRPFFNVTSFGSFISTFFLHLRQYAVTIITNHKLGSI